MRNTAAKLWIKITDSFLSYDELGLHGEKMFNRNSEIL